MTASKEASVLRVVPLTLRDANVAITALHRHHKSVQGHRFTIGATRNGILCGAAVVGRPTARMTEQYRIAEVTRLVTDGTKNACSLLYSACARAAGWKFVAMSDGGDWNRPSRSGRRTDQPMQRKQKWAREFVR